MLVSQQLGSGWKQQLAAVSIFNCNHFPSHPHTDVADKYSNQNIVGATKLRWSLLTRDRNGYWLLALKGHGSQRNKGIKTSKGPLEASFEEFE